MRLLNPFSTVDAYIMFNSYQSTYDDLIIYSPLLGKAIYQLRSCAVAAEAAVRSLQQTIQEMPAPWAVVATDTMATRIEYIQGISRFCRSGAKLLSQFTTGMQGQPLEEHEARHLLGTAMVIMRGLQDEIRTCNVLRDVITKSPNDRTAYGPSCQPA